MKNTIAYESFLLKTLTKDKFSIIVGGFCPKGKKLEASNIYEKISEFMLGQSKDEYIIDYTLAEAVKKISPEWVPVVGASVSIDNIKNKTGGIIGSPREQNESAQDEIEEIITDIYLISFPGGPGAAFKGSYSDGLELKNILIEYKKGKYDIDIVINKLSAITDLYILVEDGSGYMSRGGIYVSDNNGKHYKTFN